MRIARKNRNNCKKIKIMPIFNATKGIFEKQTVIQTSTIKLQEVALIFHVS